MEKKRRYGYLFLTAFLWGMILAGGSTQTALAGNRGKIQLTKTNITVGIGDDYTETIVIRQGKKKISGRRFRFRTTDRKIATVNGNGVIKGKKPGKVRIICTQAATGKKFTCHVTVQRYVEEITAADAQKTETALDVCLVSGYQEPFGIAEKQQMPHGKTTTVRYPQKDSDKKAKAVVYTPPGYTPSKQYNVMYLLHGAGDNETSWTQNGGAAYIMDYLYSKNLAENMILVMPDTWWEEDILDCLQPYIAKHYSISAGPEHTALAGYSMGEEQQQTSACAIRTGLHTWDCFPLPTGTWSRNTCTTNFRREKALYLHIR